MTPRFRTRIVKDSLSMLKKNCHNIDRDMWSV
jgi:hypothetical protein